MNAEWRTHKDCLGGLSVGPFWGGMVSSINRKINDMSQKASRLLISLSCLSLVVKPGSPKKEVSLEKGSILEMSVMGYTPFKTPLYETADQQLQ